MRTPWIAGIVGIGLLGLSWNATAEQRPSLDHVAAVYRTPQTIASFLREAFTFQRDEDLFNEVDRWQSPEEFLQRRAGDCEDYALLAKELLRRNGIEAYVFSLFGEEGYAHTVSVFVDEDGRYNVINQDKLLRYRAPSLEQVAAQINPAWSVGMIAEQDGPRGRVVRELINEHSAPPRNF